MTVRIVAGSTVRELAEPSRSLRGGEESTAMINTQGDLLIAQTMPPLAEVVRLGRSYTVIETTAVAPVVAIPTTSAKLAIWNGEPDNGRCYIIDSVFAIAATASISQSFMMVGQLNLGRKAATTNSALQFKSLSAYGVRLTGTTLGYQGRGRVSIAQAVTNDNAWQALGTSFLFDDVSPIGSIVTACQCGRIIVPPGHIFGISCISTDAGSTTVRHGIRWHEVQMPVGPTGGG